ncbi:MAG: hypothetical protein JWN06_2563 [Propionibacteriaceae bacterium]|jgi:hypothetical protein|nr:hypothetical protein [Propionibacteriaceae bacterium]
MVVSNQAGTSKSTSQCEFKDLCIDTGDPTLAAAFWSRALGLRPEPGGNSMMLGDDHDQHTVWLNLVPEPKTVKNRVHLDLHTADLSELTALGARPVAQEHSWTVMEDPEGAEFCAFLRQEELPSYRLYELVVDSTDVGRIARWWADRYGVQPTGHPDQGFWLENAPGMPWDMVFNPVPEAKTVKNRVHWDVWGDPEDFLAAGAILLRGRDDEIGWDVLADPDGNEFCVFTRP